VIQLYVGTDPQQHKADRALEASVRANTSQPVDIHWMRQGEAPWDWGGLECGWATPFSMFRWAVPEAAGYKGRAIYMDCDMIALGDLAELWEWPLPADSPGAFAGRMSNKADVILWQCENVPRWPREMFTGRHAEVRAAGAKVLRGSQLPPEWDHVDEVRPGWTKILHLSKLSVQPWRPYPQRYDYEKPHPCPAACEVFWRYAGGMD